IMAALLETAGSDLCCSICLDFYKDPVILDCSHSFCRACISQVWEKRERDLSCPQCRQVFPERSMKPNLALANTVESLKEIDLRAKTSKQSQKWQKLEEKEEFYCEEHEEKLKLFCKEDEKMVCLICGMSQSHKSHTLLPIKAAFQIYKEKLEVSVNVLQSQLNKAYKCGKEGKKKFQEKSIYLKEQIRDDFSKLHEFLHKEEEKLKEKLERKEMEILQQLEEYEVKTAQQISKLEQSISEIQKQLNSERAEELLKARVKLSYVNNIHVHKNKSRIGEKRNRISRQPLKGKYRISVFLVKTYRMWRRMKDIFSYPGTDISSQLTQGRQIHSLLFQKTGPVCSYCAALGSKGFISGRRYWEVKVGNKEEWMLGVIRESVDRKSMPYVTNKNGFYVIRREKERICIPFITNLPFPVNLSKIGVYLDYEGGQVAFYNTDDLSHIHTYTYTFTEKMYPYFDVWWNSNRNTPEPLKLITPNN
uniref:Uncharacterized protein n=1 Tax=Latimeria chalumnae TaxID=7897 RepID=H3B0C8_LATCH